MALALTEEHLALADSVRGWAAHNCPPSAIRAGLEAEDHGAGGGRRAGAGAARGGGTSGARGRDKQSAASYRDTLRPGLAAQGLLGLHLPEALGGQGSGLPELAVATEELGRALFPGGFLPTVLASAVLTGAATGAADAGVLESLVKGMAAGTLTAAVALAPGIHAVADAGARADGGLVISGSCGPVLGACLADLLILPARRNGAESWVVVDAADLEITPLDSLDLTRPIARVSASGLRVPAERVLSGLPQGLVTSLAATLFGAEACGIAGWAVDTAAAYAKIRHQFGRPIGQFQAVKHRCAWMLTAAEQAAAAVWDAARAHQEPAGDDDGAGRAFAAGVAAAVAVDAAVTCVHECIQVLGGIGYTWEHDAHLYYRRALSLRALLGSSGEWAARVARLALSGASRPLRVELPAEAETVRAQVRQELTAIAAAPPAEHATRLAVGGFVVPHMPRPWGRDASPLEQLVIAEEMRSVGLRPPGLGIGAWVVPALIQYGTAEQQQLFLPATLSGETIWCQLFSEPGAGSDLASLSTRAERTDGGWRLTGQKVWTSLAAHAQWAICVARTDPDAPRHDGISYFLVDMKGPGVTVRPLRELTGDALFNEVFLDGVFVPDDLVVGGVNDGWRVARTTLANERVSLAQSWTFGCGAPELLEVLRGLPDSPDAAVLERAGRLVAEGHAIDILGLRAALKRLSGTEPGATGSVRKLLGMRYAQRVAEECWALTAADGAVAGTRWSRAILFARALTIGGGTTDVQLNIIGERILGLPRDPAPGT
jgi:alkylation response protein AidB-like acyl-CoA dehydrogenase